jgi:superfamily II DNA or RNA helicase
MKLIIHANLIILSPTQALIDKARKDLTIGNPKYYMNKHLGIWNNTEPETLEIFSLAGDVLEVPRGYDISDFLTQFENIDDQTVKLPASLPIIPNLTPFQFQTDATDAFVASGQGGIIAPCGAGKTEIAINIINRLRVPTLVIVHKVDLVHQWHDRIRTRLGLDAATVIGSKKKVGLVTIATVQSLYSISGLTKFTAENFYSKFAMVILDEAHHAPAKSWMQILAKCPAQYRLWLTATEKRKDGLGPTLPLIGGRIVYRVEHKALLEIGRIIAPEYVEHNLSFVTFTPKKMVCDRKSKESREIVNNYALDQAIMFNTQRNEYIVSQIEKDYHAGKFILVLSPKNVNHCEMLHAMLESRNIKSELLVASGNFKVKPKDRERILAEARVGTCRLIIATSLAEEGLDVPVLDTIHLTYPMTYCEQAVGRIMRSCCTKAAATVHDYVDVCISYLVERAKGRRKFFKTIGSKKTFGNLEPVAGPLTELDKLVFNK